jgi:2-oxoglutarate ferredoxin oxidoreductase subunit beta
MRFYKDNSVILHNIDPVEAEIDLHNRIVVGKFVDIDKPTYIQEMREGVSRAQKVI